MVLDEALRAACFGLLYLLPVPTAHFVSTRHKSDRQPATIYVQGNNTFSAQDTASWQQRNFKRCQATAKTRKRLRAFLLWMLRSELHALKSLKQAAGEQCQATGSSALLGSSQQCQYTTTWAVHLGNSPVCVPNRMFTISWRQDLVSRFAHCHYGVHTTLALTPGPQAPDCSRCQELPSKRPWR